MRLADLVSALPQARVELELSQETQAVHVACGRTEANIKGIDAQEFPLTPEAETAQMAFVSEQVASNA